MVSPSSPERRTSMRSAALSSLFPFLLFFFGHYFSLSVVVSDYLTGEKGYHYYPAGGGSLWVSGDDDFVAQVMAVVFLSYLLLCLSTVATVVSAAVDPSGSRPHPLLESFSKARALWWRLRQPSSSAARLYFAFLFLGYLLSLLAVLVATLVAVAGGDDALSLGTWRLLASLLVLFAFLYVGILRWSVGLLPAGADEEGGHEAAAVAKAPWSTALALVEETKLQGFFLFFFSLLAVHGVLLLSRGLYWEEQYFYANRRRVWGGGGGFLENAAIWSIRHPSLILPLVVSSVWMLGTCRLFGYLGALLQVC